MFKRIKGYLLHLGQCFQGGRDKNSEYEWIREGFSFKCLKPLAKKNTFLNRAGLVGFYGELKTGEKVKIYECVSSEQAKFIQEVTSSPEMAKYFPTVYFIENRFLVCEWKEGETLTWKKIFSDENILSQLAQMQVDFHSCQSLSEKNNVYLHLLRNRFFKYKGVLDFDEFFAKVSHYLNGSEGEEPFGISHPDITDRNLIFSDKGTLVSIDNETLGYNTYFLYDLFETFNSVKQPLYPEFFNRYLKRYHDLGGVLDDLFKQPGKYEAIYYLRHVGNKLQRGDYPKASDLSRQYLKKETRIDFFEYLKTM